MVAIRAGSDQARSPLRRAAVEIAEAGLASLDPGEAVNRLLALDGSQLHAGGVEINLDAFNRVLVLGAGKATLRIAEEVERLLGERVAGGLVVVRRGSGRPLRRVEVLEADHPVPSASSAEAARRLLKLADEAGERDLIVALVTGGSSALVCAPPPGVSFHEKVELHRLLLSSGAAIGAINTVRKHVSDVKGGRLAERAQPATILNLTVSDVVGDVLDLLADLTVQDTSAVEQAVEVLNRFELTERVAPSILRHLSTAAASSPDLSRCAIETVMLATGDQACAAMAKRSRELGFEPLILGSALQGESRDAGTIVAGLARECARSGVPAEPPCALVACGGETTVSLGGHPGLAGLGGPNQELALAAAAILRPEDCVALIALDTDGSDGGTDAAGALVDGTSYIRAGELGVDLDNALRDHRAHGALAAIGDLVHTGSTLTNANDLVVAVVGRAQRRASAAPSPIAEVLLRRRSSPQIATRRRVRTSTSSRLRRRIFEIRSRRW